VSRSTLSPRIPAEVIRDRLSVYLGPHTARTALRTFSQRTFGIAPEQVSLVQIPQLLDALRPALRTLLGSEQTEAVIRSLIKELGT
jgi:hypothetical protein